MAIALGGALSVAAWSCGTQQTPAGDQNGGLLDGATSGADSGPNGDGSPCVGAGCTLVEEGGDGQIPQDGGALPGANLVIAHTAPGVPPLRVCLATASALAASPSVVPIPPLPDTVGVAPAYPATGPYSGVAAGTPGIYPGTIGAFPSLGLSYEELAITPFVVLASSIANDVDLDGGVGVNLGDGGIEETCVALIGTHGLGAEDTASGSTPGRLTLGTDFFPLPVIPFGTLANAKTYLLTVNGCLPGGTVLPATTPGEPALTCGSGDAGPWIGVAEMDTTTVPADGGIGVQFAHRSTALESTPVLCTTPSCTSDVEIHAPASDGVWPAFLTPFDFDAGEGVGEQQAFAPTELAQVPVSYSGPVGVTTPQGGSAISPVVSVPVNVAGGSTTYFGVLVQPLDGGAPNANPWPGTFNGAPAPGDLILLPLSKVQLLSAWNATTVGGSLGFVPGQNYTFILTGDPSAEQLLNADGGLNPEWDGRGVEFLAFPNVFKSK
ncbi:MAG: hypothetical protein ACLQVI_12725 [Polyangiaceae bacterium]|jgi:hypothetical protein